MNCVRTPFSGTIDCRISSSPAKTGMKANFYMGNSEIIWVNRTVAMLARLHRVKAVRPVWTTEGSEQYKLTIHAGQRSASTLLNINSMREGFRGNDEVQATIVRELSGLMRSLVTAPGSQENRSPSQ
jgi:hypothetical protein